jgi:hypothetical protein
VKTLSPTPRQISQESSATCGLSESRCPTRFASHLTTSHLNFDGSKLGSRRSKGSKSADRERARKIDSPSSFSKANRVFRFTLYESKTR